MQARGDRHEARQVELRLGGSHGPSKEDLAAAILRHLDPATSVWRGPGRRSG